MKNRILTITLPLALMIGVSLASAIGVRVAVTLQPLASSTSTLTVADAQPASRVERQNIYVIGTHGAPRTEANNWTGLRRHFIDPVEGRAWLIDALVNSPFDDVFIHMPAGWGKDKVRGRDPGDPSVRMGAAQRASIDEAHLAMFDGAIGEALRIRPTLKIRIYIALKLSSPFSIDMAGWHWAQLDSREHRWAIDQCVAPWIAAGVSGFWFDASSHANAREDSIAWAAHYAQPPYNVWIGIEAFPTDRQTDGTWKLDLAVMDQIPTIALLQFVRHRDPNGQWDVTGLASQATVWVSTPHADPPPTVDELLGRLRSGFGLATNERHRAVVLAALARYERELQGGRDG